ncbi:preprotein translocase subunit SecG [Vallitalea guaymasensis]|uniref:Protein-export membrane protein SecG n=1 Tax=Vallitalea guaymasensis TaxID=1185412 RepID=A0A8J8MDA5_9FIRM|nr:preprotein translocase subunit SecG [Vallitalea guaymasensis]QUH30768.1 preprotein translocase subunit SecG [Vallitalea guaymasensis]
MGALIIIVEIVYFILCLGLIAVVLLQKGKAAGLSGAIGGAAETYWGKNKARSMEGKLEKFTRLGAILFIVLSVVLSLLIKYQ